MADHLKIKVESQILHERSCGKNCNRPLRDIISVLICHSHLGFVRKEIFFYGVSSCESGRYSFKVNKAFKSKTITLSVGAAIFHKTSRKYITNRRFHWIQLYHGWLWLFLASRQRLLYVADYDVECIVRCLNQWAAGKSTRWLRVCTAETLLRTPGFDPLGCESSHHQVSVKPERNADHT